MEVIRSIAVVKKCAAIANYHNGSLKEQHCDLISTAAQEVHPKNIPFGRSSIANSIRTFLYPSGKPVQALKRI